jgi:hypothetical protein
VKIVYIAHALSAPTREGIEENRRRASLWAAWAAVSEGVSPSCSWIVLTGVLEETPENRERGLACDLAQVARCDEVWLVGGRVSSGMRHEADHAITLAIPVIDLIALGELPPPLKGRTLAEVFRDEECPPLFRDEDCPP